MTTATMNNVINYLSDTGYRNWINDLHTLLSTAGLVQTSDTGQVNTSTITRPATATTNCYSIWRLPDSSLYFKLSLGGWIGGGNIVRIDIQVGEGSNGAGTLTGAQSTNTMITPSTNANSEVIDETTPFASYCCVTNDYFCLIYGISSNESALAYRSSYSNFVCAKTVNSNGVATSTGFFVYSHSQIGSTSTTAPSFQSVRRTSPAVASAINTSFCLVPGATSSYPSSPLNDSGSLVCYLHWGNFPESLPMLHMCSVRLAGLSGFPSLSKFTATFFGSTPHTYLYLGGSNPSTTEASGVNTNFRPAVLWE